MFRKLLFVCICLGGSVFGSTIISDLGAGALDASGTSAVDYTAPATVGTGFTMGATSFDHVSFSLGLLAIGTRSLGPFDVTVEVFGGDATAPSGPALLTLLPSGPHLGTVARYTFTAPTDFTLDANTTYWLVASAVADQQGWVTFGSSFADRQPTGAFATAPLGYNRSGSGLPTDLFSNSDTVAYEVDGTAVVLVSSTPEPATFGFAGLALSGLILFHRSRQSQWGARRR